MPKTKPITQFYVYMLRDPRPGKNKQPFYVGKGRKRRAHIHLVSPETHPNPMMRHMLLKIASGNLKPIIEIIQYCDTEEDAFQLEIYLIAQYGRRDLKFGSLCNLTNGGEGISGRIAGQEERAWRREEMRKLNADPEFAKANVERTRKLHADPEFAKARNKRARGLLRKLHADPEFAKRNAERASKHMLKLHSNSEFRKACGERLRKFNADPEFAMARDDRARKHFRKLHADPEFMKTNAERARDHINKFNANPELVRANAKRSSERLRSLNSNPEFAKARDERLRKLRANPEFQARLAAGLAAYHAKRRAQFALL